MNLKSGDRIMFQCAAYELLYLVLTAHNRKTWKARPLFVEQPDLIITIRATDRVSFIHSKAA